MEVKMFPAKSVHQDITERAAQLVHDLMQVTNKITSKANTAGDAAINFSVVLTGASLFLAAEVKAISDCTVRSFDEVAKQIAELFGQYLTLFQEGKIKIT